MRSSKTSLESRHRARFFSKCINVHRRLLVKDDDIELGEEKEEQMLQIKERDQCTRAINCMHLCLRKTLPQDCPHGESRHSDIGLGFFQNASMCTGGS